MGDRIGGARELKEKEQAIGKTNINARDKAQTKEEPKENIIIIIIALGIKKRKLTPTT